MLHVPKYPREFDRAARRPWLPANPAGPAESFQDTDTRAPPENAESCSSIALTCVPGGTSNGTSTATSNPGFMSCIQLSPAAIASDSYSRPAVSISFWLLEKNVWASLPVFVTVMATTTHSPRGVDVPYRDARLTPVTRNENFPSLTVVFIAAGADAPNPDPVEFPGEESSMLAPMAVWATHPPKNRTTTARVTHSAVLPEDGLRGTERCSVQRARRSSVDPARPTGLDTSQVEVKVPPCGHGSPAPATFNHETADTWAPYTGSGRWAHRRHVRRHCGLEDFQAGEVASG